MKPQFPDEQSDDGRFVRHVEQVLELLDVFAGLGLAECALVFALVDAVDRVLDRLLARREITCIHLGETELRKNDRIFVIASAP